MIITRALKKKLSTYLLKQNEIKHTVLISYMLQAKQIMCIICHIMINKHTFAAFAKAFFSFSVTNQVFWGREKISSLCIIMFSAYNSKILWGGIKDDLVSVKFYISSMHTSNCSKTTNVKLKKKLQHTFVASISAFLNALSSLKKYKLNNDYWYSQIIIV